MRTTKEFFDSANGDFSDQEFDANIIPETFKSHFLVVSKLLREKQENDFIQHIKNDGFEAEISVDNNQRKKVILCLLKIAIKNGLNKAVEVLLQKKFFGVEEAGYIGIETACNVGNSQALKVLLEQNNINLKNKNLLIKVTKMLDETNENNDYIGCFDVLLESSKIDVNEGYDLQSPALHYAIQKKNEEAILKLLDKGAHLDRMSLLYIDPKILENFFDKCVTTNDHQYGEQDFEIGMNYKNFQQKNLKGIYFNKTHEILAIKQIAESKHLKHLLSHPLITSFLFLKWHQLSSLFYMNFSFCFSFCILLIAYIISDLNDASIGFQILFKCLSTLGLIYITVRKTFQCFALKKDMFSTSFAALSNCVEITLIAFTMLTFSYSNYQNEPQRTYAVFTILLVSVEIYLLIGSLPFLIFSTHMLMLNAVCVSFVKSCFQYVIFFITFGLCFHIVFRKRTDNKNNESSNTNNGHFNSVFGSIFKIIIMITGEFDSGNINFDSFVSYWVFILFVAFMSIILLNLLNGLAVNDTQVIRTQAELNGSICRTYVLANLEKSLKLAKKIEDSNYIFKNLTTSIQDYINGDHIFIRPYNDNKILIYSKNQLNQKQFLRSSILIFPNYHCFKLKFCKMEITTVQAALSVLKKKEQIQEQERIVLEQKIRLKNIEKKVEEQDNRLKNIEKKVSLSLPLLRRLAKDVKKICNSHKRR